TTVAKAAAKPMRFIRAARTSPLATGRCGCSARTSASAILLAWSLATVGRRSTCRKSTCRLVVRVRLADCAIFGHRKAVYPRIGAPQMQASDAMMATTTAISGEAEGSALTPRYSLWQLTAYFLRLGTLGFGGPVALVGNMHRDLVERLGWISESDYKEG